MIEVQEQLLLLTSLIAVKDGVAVMHVIKNSDQILPYCVINLQDVTQNNQSNFPLLQHNHTTAQTNPPLLPPRNTNTTNVAQRNLLPVQSNFPPLQSSFPPANNLSPVQSYPPPQLLPLHHLPPPSAHITSTTRVTLPPQPSFSTVSSNPAPAHGMSSIMSFNNIRSVSTMHLCSPLRSTHPSSFFHHVSSPFHPPDKGQTCQTNQLPSQAADSASSVTVSNSKFVPSSPPSSTLTSLCSGMFQDVPSYPLQLPSTSTQPSDDTEECKKKLQELKKYVEPLKKKIESTDPSHFHKLLKLLEIITYPKKKVPLNVLIKCENELKQCLP
eukprot:GFUD01069241.1.p1 GENE.GFUD01069241.1~~GFUD01069241.1.p1  ORF type:complete len:327 (+),score=64.12 GFUD01069241.1:892-1872(+)